MTNDDFPGGVHSEKQKESSDSLQKELSSLNGSLKKLISTLLERESIKYTSSVDTALKKEYGDLKNAYGISEKTTKEFVSKAEKILDNFNTYAKKNEEIKKLGESQLKRLYEQEKERLDTIKKLTRIQEEQQKLLLPRIDEINERARFLQSDWKRRQAEHPNRITSEEFGLTTAQFQKGESLAGSALLQAFMGSSPILQAIGERTGLVTSQENYQNKIANSGKHLEKEFFKSRGMYVVNPENEEDSSYALQKGESLTGPYASLLEQQKLLNRNLLTLGKQDIPDLSGIDDLTLSSNRQSQKRTSRENSLPRNIIPFYNIRGEGSSYSEHLNDFESNKASIPLVPLPADVRTILGKESVGYLYLGSLITEFTKLYKKTNEELNENINNSGGAGINTPLLTSLLSKGALTTMISSILPVLLPALGITIGVAALAFMIKAMVDDTKKRSEEKEATNAKLNALIDTNPELRKSLEKKGLLTKGMNAGASNEEGVSTEAANARFQLTQEKEVLKVDTSGLGVPTSYYGSDTGINILNEVNKSKEEYRKEAMSYLGADPRKKGGFYWSKRDGIYYVSKNERDPGAPWPFEGDPDKGKVFNAAWRSNKDFSDIQADWAGNPGGFSNSFDYYLNKGNNASVKFHIGGIIGQKEIIAQNGEAILPVEDTKYGVENNILVPTTNGGLSLNKDFSSLNAEATVILQKIYEYITNGMITNFKELSSSTQESGGIPLPSLIPSYGA